MTNHTTRKRTDMACLTCRHRKIKCESNKPDPCRNCIEKGKECVYIPVSEDAHMIGLNRTTPPVVQRSLEGPSSPSSRHSPPTGASYQARPYGDGRAYTAQTNSVHPHVAALSSPIQDQSFEVYQGYTEPGSSSYTSYPGQGYQPYLATSGHQTPAYSSHPGAELATGMPLPAGDYGASSVPHQTWAQHTHSNVVTPTGPYEQVHQYAYPTHGSATASRVNFAGNQYQAAQSGYYASGQPDYAGQSYQYSDARHYS